MAAQSATLLASFLCVAGVVTGSWDHLHVKYALIDGFYDVPRTVAEAASDGYVKMSHDEDLRVDLYSYPDDPRVSILFDSYGNIAGIRTAYIKADVTKQADAKGMKFNYTYDDKPMYTSGNYYNTPLWHTSVLFVSPGKLKSGGRASTGGKVAEDIYMKVDGVWTNIPKDECQAESVGFTKQSCFIGMGMHYFYKVTPEMDCNDHQGAFLLYESGELIGLGFNPFGAFTKKEREWFEEVPANVVVKIVPKGPECMKEWVSSYGSTSFHIFFKRFPRLTVCTWPWQKSGQCNK